MREMEFIRNISELGEVFTAEEAMRAVRINKGAFYYHIRRLREDGVIERIGRGRYRFVFPYRNAEDPFVLASVMVPSGAIAYWTALNYYGMTEQMPRVTYVITNVRGNYKHLHRFGIRVVIVRSRKFFGFDEVWISGRRVKITNPEKTVADCLDRPGNCGGIVEVTKALRSGVNMERVMEYLKRMRSNAGLKRFGYLAEVLGLSVPRIVEEVERMRGYVLLDPTLDSVGKWCSRWKVIVNVPEGYVEG